MSEEELKKEIDELILSFSSLDIVKRYHQLKKEVFEDEKLNSLEKSRTALQKGIKYMKDEKKDECIKAAKELQIEHDNNPLYVNYLSVKQEVYSLLSYLDEITF